MTSPEEQHEVQLGAVAEVEKILHDPRVVPRAMVQPARCHQAPVVGFLGLSVTSGGYAANWTTHIFKIEKHTL